MTAAGRNGADAPTRRWRRAEPRLPPRRPAATLAAPSDGATRLNALANLFRYDLRRGLGLVDALRADPLAVVAGLCLLAAAGVGGGWSLSSRWSDLSPEVVPVAALIVGFGLALALDPLPRLRAGPLAELGEDIRAVWAWLWLRGLAVLAVIIAVILVPALAMHWRPDAAFADALAIAAAGVAVGATIRLAPPLPGLRLPARPISRGRPAPVLRDRAARLAWIDLGRRQAGLPVGLWAMLAWIAAAVVGLAATDPRLRPVVEAAGAAFAFLAAVLTLRFDAAAVRLLTFEPTGFLRLARDALGLRLLAVAVVAGAITPVSGFAVLAGAGLGAGYRVLEFLHAVRRPGPMARLMAQLETVLIVALAVVAGPAAAVWLLFRSAWLCRRAARSMGLA